LPDPPHILKKRNQLLKRKVGIAKLGRVALFFEGDDVAGENRPKFGRPAFGAAAAEQRKISGNFPADLYKLPF
jgi:hypothetical protein